MKIYRLNWMVLGCSLFLLSQGKALAAPGSNGSQSQAFAKSQEVTSHSSKDATITGLSARSRDGTWLILAAEKGKLLVEGGAVRHTFYHCAPKALVLSADGRLLVCAGAAHCQPGEIKVWDLESGSLLCTIATELSDTPRAAVSADRQWLVCTTGKGRLSLWQIADGQSRWSVSLNRAVREVSFTSDGGAVVARCADKTIRTVALTDGALLSIPATALNP